MSRPEATARAADPADRAILVELAALAATEARDERGGVLLLDFDFAAAGAEERIDQAFADGDSAVHVGSFDGTPVGYAVVTRTTSGPVTVAHVSELFVHPDARSVGVAAALLEHLQLWARNQGCAVFESQVLPGNRAAKNFFERMGMVTRAMRVSVRLEG